MANYTVTDTELTDIADAIIAKAGLSGQLEFPDDFVDGIESISTGTDVSDTTATASDVRTGKYFYTSSGTKTQGSIADMTLPTSTAASADGTNKATVSRSTSDQYINIPAGYNASKASYKVNAVANGSATTPATTITANPSISVSNSGLITATTSASQSVTPTVSAGYVSSGTAGTVTVSGSNTSQLTTQAAQTIHPSATDQTIASGKYLTGTQTVKGVLLTNLDAGNIKKDVVVKVGDSTDDDCVTSVTGTYEGSGGGGADACFSLTVSTSPQGALLFESGMTWEQWVNSEYNVPIGGLGAFDVSGGKIRTWSAPTYLYISTTSSGSTNYVSPSDTIINHRYYYVKQYTPK